MTYKKYKHILESIEAEQQTKNFQVITKRAVFRCMAGDYIVIINGEKFPIEKTIFEALYGAVAR